VFPSSFTTDYRSPWKQRWGGWYVTGTHGAMRHMGNTFAIDRSDPQKIDVDGGANLTELSTRVYNLITRANYEARQAVQLQ
jgi:hypothetical protein